MFKCVRFIQRIGINLKKSYCVSKFCGRECPQTKFSLIRTHYYSVIIPANAKKENIIQNQLIFHCFFKYHTNHKSKIPITGTAISIITPTQNNKLSNNDLIYTLSNSQKHFYFIQYFNNYHIISFFYKFKIPCFKINRLYLV